MKIQVTEYSYDDDGGLSYGDKTTYDDWSEVYEEIEMSSSGGTLYSFNEVNK